MFKYINVFGYDPYNSLDAIMVTEDVVDVPWI